MGSEVGLSVLVATVPERQESYFPLVEKLTRQADAAVQIGNAEVLGLSDNRFRSIGMKRNALLDMANGRFVAFVDDDDDVADDYIASLLRAGAESPDADVIVFDMLGDHAGAKRHWRFRLSPGPAEEAWINADLHGDEPPAIRRIVSEPTHLCAWSARLAKATTFDDFKSGEVGPWMARMVAVASRQAIIDKILYRYQFSLGRTLRG